MDNSTTIPKTEVPPIVQEVEVRIDDFGCLAGLWTSPPAVPYTLRINAQWTEPPTPFAMARVVHLAQHARSVCVVGHQYAAHVLMSELARRIRAANAADAACATNPNEPPLPF